MHPLHVHTHVHPADLCTLSAPRARSQVLEKEEENFPEIINLLERHATLEAANIDLTYRKDSAASLNEQMREDLQDYLRAKSDEILAANNKTKVLQGQMEEVGEERKEEEVRKEEQVTKVQVSTLDLGQVKMACENIYSRCLGKPLVSLEHAPRACTHACTPHAYGTRIACMHTGAARLARHGEARRA